MCRDQKDQLRIRSVRDGFDGRPLVCQRAQDQSRIEPLTGDERLSSDEAVEKGLHDG